MMIQVLFDSEQQTIVYAEAESGFVDGLYKLLLAPYHELLRFAGPESGGYPDHDGNRTSRMPLSTLQESLAALDNSVFSSGGNTVKAQFAAANPQEPLVISLCDVSAGFDNPRMVLTKNIAVTNTRSKCSHGQFVSDCPVSNCVWATINTFKRELGEKVTVESGACPHGHQWEQIAHGRPCGCKVLNCQKQVLRKLELIKLSSDADEAKAAHLDKSVLMKPGHQLVVADDLEVSRGSSITCIELLRRHQPDATRWTNFVGLKIEVVEADFRAIARSALSGRACVLNDALGAKAAKKFASSSVKNVASRSPPPGAGAHDGDEAASDKSYDLFE